MRKARQRWRGVLLLVGPGKVVPAREESRRRRDGVGSHDRRNGRRVPTKAAAAGCSSRAARPRRRPSWPPACSAQPGCIRGRVAAQGLQAMGFWVPPGCLGSEPSHARSGAALALGPQRLELCYLQLQSPLQCVWSLYKHVLCMVMLMVLSMVNMDKFLVSAKNFFYFILFCFYKN